MTRAAGQSDGRTMRLLVLGGTVFLSRTISDLAVARGYDVELLARRHATRPKPGA